MGDEETDTLRQITFPSSPKPHKSPVAERWLVSARAELVEPSRSLIDQKRSKSKNGCPIPEQPFFMNE